MRKVTSRIRLKGWIYSLVIPILVVILPMNVSGIPQSDGFDPPVKPIEGIYWWLAQDFCVLNPSFGNKLHLGEDWNWGSGSDDLGKSIYAVSNGTVRSVSYPNDSWRWVVIIDHVLPDGTRVVSMYAHLQNVMVTAGQDVARGQKIAEVGPTPTGSTGPHLHWEMRTNTAIQVGPGYSNSCSGWIDPTDFVNSHRRLVRGGPPPSTLTLQQAVSKGYVELESKAEAFGDGVTFIGTGKNPQDLIVKVRRGDIILAKDPDAQDFVVTRDDEFFLPANQPVRKEGIWVACIDPDIPLPRRGEKLDVTLNLKDWNNALALQLLDRLENQQDQLTLEAVWEITEQEGFPKHVSNPNSNAPTSGFSPSPEVSFTFFLAGYFENCPEHTPQPNRLICRKELEYATWLYLNDQPAPAPYNRKITYQELREVVSYFLTGTLIDQVPPELSSQAVEEELRRLKGGAVSSSANLKLARVWAAPNSIRTRRAVVFRAQGANITSIQIRVYDLSGRQVANSGWVSGSAWRWNLSSNSGQPLANGLYLYLVSLRGPNGSLFRSELKKLVVLR